MALTVYGLYRLAQDKYDVIIPTAGRLHPADCKKSCPTKMCGTTTNNEKAFPFYTC